VFSPSSKFREPERLFRVYEDFTDAIRNIRNRYPPGLDSYRVE